MTTTREFEELTLDGSNYPTWASDIKIALAARKISSTIQEPQQGVVVTDHQNYSALTLLRFYIHKDFKAEYVMIENSRELWVALKDRYDQKKNLFGLRPTRMESSTLTIFQNRG
jgi:hypothetical protein